MQSTRGEPLIQRVAGTDPSTTTTSDTIRREAVVSGEEAEGQPRKESNTERYPRPGSVPTSYHPDASPGKREGLVLDVQGVRSSVGENRSDRPDQAQSRISEECGSGHLRETQGTRTWKQYCEWVLDTASGKGDCCDKLRRFARWIAQKEFEAEQQAE